MPRIMRVTSVDIREPVSAQCPALAPPTDPVNSLLTNAEGDLTGMRNIEHL